MIRAHNCCDIVGESLPKGISHRFQFDSDSFRLSYVHPRDIYISLTTSSEENNEGHDMMIGIDSTMFANEHESKHFSLGIE